MTSQDGEAPLTLLHCPLAAARFQPSAPDPRTLTPILKGLKVTSHRAEGGNASLNHIPAVTISRVLTVRQLGRQARSPPSPSLCKRQSYHLLADEDTEASKGCKLLFLPVKRFLNLGCDITTIVGRVCLCSITMGTQLRRSAFGGGVLTCMDGFFTYIRHSG